MKLKKALFILCGCLSLVAGALGAVLPLLPTVPLLLLAAFCFAKGSEKLHIWFLSTQLYQNHLDQYMQNPCMTLRTKLRIMTGASATMGLSFFLMDGILIGRIVLACVWIFHVLYFVFRVETIREAPKPDALDKQKFSSSIEE